MGDWDVLNAIREHDDAERARAARWQEALELIDTEVRLRTVLEVLRVPVDQLAAPARLCTDQTVAVIYELPRYDDQETRLFPSLDRARTWWKGPEVAYSDDSYELIGVYDHRGEPLPNEVLDLVGCAPPPEKMVEVTAAYRLKVPAAATGGLADVTLMPGDTVTVRSSYGARLDAGHVIVRPNPFTKAGAR